MRNKNRKYIVVGGDNLMPMTFQEPQFCYVPTRGRSRFYLKTYTEKEANKLIHRSIQFKMKNNLSLINYYLIPLAS